MKESASAGEGEEGNERKDEPRTEGPKGTWDYFNWVL